MIIKSDNLVLKAVDQISDSLKAKMVLDNEITSMTEVKLYPPNLPTEFTFEIINDENVIGELKLKSFRWINRKAELSIFILKEFRNKGFGKEAISTIIKYAFEKLNLHRLEAEVIEYNEGSKKMVEGFGFILEGRLREAKHSNGKYYDILRYGLLKSEFNKGRNK